MHESCHSTWSMGKGSDVTRVMCRQPWVGLAQEPVWLEFSVAHRAVVMDINWLYTNEVYIPPYFT